MANTITDNRLGWFCMPVLCFSIGILLASSMLKPVSRDEQMYCSAGALMAQDQLVYRDFAYPSQMPYHPLLLAGIYRLTKGTEQYLLWGRFLSVLGSIISLVSFVLIFRIAFTDHPGLGSFIGSVCGFWLSMNPLIDYAFGHAWNHDLVVACILICVYVFMLSIKDRLNWRFAVITISVLLTFACWTRATMGVIYLFFLFVLLIKAHTHKSILATLTWFLGISLLVSLWPLWVFWQAPQAFLMNLLDLPRLYGQYLYEIGMVHPKLALSVHCLTQPAVLVLLISWLGLWCFMLFHRGGGWKSLHALLVLGIPLMLVIVALAPPTMWIQYWAIPLPFIIVGLAPPLARIWQILPIPSKRWFGIGIGIWTFVLLLLNPLPLVRLESLCSIENWVPVQMHQQAQIMGKEIRDPKRTLTLAPLWALEAGAQIYPELATGSIVYRIGDRLNPQQQKLTHTVGPESLADLIALHPPNAIITGCETKPFHRLEASLEIAVDESFTQREFENGPTLLLAP